MKSTTSTPPKTNSSPRKRLPAASPSLWIGIAADHRTASPDPARYVTPLIANGTPMTTHPRMSAIPR